MNWPTSEIAIRDFATEELAELAQRAKAFANDARLRFLLTSLSRATRRARRRYREASALAQDRIDKLDAALARDLGARAKSGSPSQNWLALNGTGGARREALLNRMIFETAHQELFARSEVAKFELLFDQIELDDQYLDDIWSQYDKLLLIVANQKKYAEVSARLSQNKRVQRKLAQYAIEVLEGHLPALDWPL